MLAHQTPHGNPALDALARVRALRARCAELEAAQRRDDPTPPEAAPVGASAPRLGRPRTRPVDGPPLTWAQLGEAALVVGEDAGADAAHAARLLRARALLAGLAASDAALDAFARRESTRLLGARALAARVAAPPPRHVVPPAVATPRAATVHGPGRGVNFVAVAVADDRACPGGPAATSVAGGPSPSAAPDPTPRTGPATPEGPAEVSRPDDGPTAPGGSAQGGRLVRPARCILVAPDGGRLPTTAPPGPPSVPALPGGATCSAGDAAGTDGPGAQERAAPPLGVARPVVTFRAPDRPPTSGGGPRADTLRRAPSRPRLRPCAPRPRLAARERAPPAARRGPPARAGPS